MLKIREAGFGVLFRVKRSIDFTAKFLLVGNTIDGFVTIDIEEFHNFEDLKSRLPILLSTIECRGEWNVKLFQITKPYRIIKKYGYFKTPSHGKLILEYSYMDYPIKSVNFLPNKIQMICSSLEVIENWDANSNEDFLNYGIDVEVRNIFIS
jgi:hypothetical protein